MSAFATPVQLEKASSGGKKESRWLSTERHIDHGGLELCLRDMEPRPWARNIIRDLIALMVLEDSGGRVEVKLHPKLDTAKRIRKVLRRLGVRQWWSEA